MRTLRPSLFTIRCTYAICLAGVERQPRPHSARSRADSGDGGMPLFVCAYWTMLTFLGPLAAFFAGKAKTRRDAHRGHHHQHQQRREGALQPSYARCKRNSGPLIAKSLAAHINVPRVDFGSSTHEGRWPGPPEITTGAQKLSVAAFSFSTKTMHFVDDAIRPMLVEQLAIICFPLYEL